MGFVIWIKQGLSVRRDWFRFPSGVKFLTFDEDEVDQAHAAQKFVETRLLQPRAIHASRLSA
jgi:hypothetical protein